MPQKIRNVIKSKSSNSAIVNKTNTEITKIRIQKYKNCLSVTNKKSKSNSYFQPLALKKRGVYVEKNHNVSGVIKSKERTEIRRPQPLRPGRKEFLQSVYSILSKSTINNHNSSTSNANPSKTQKGILKINNTETENQGKHNFVGRSKYISRNFNKENQEPLTIIQPRKEIIQTPSTYSTSSKLNTDCVYITKMKNIDKEKHKTQLVSNKEKNAFQEKKKDVETGQKDLSKDKHLYNFFVDLLESTLSDNSMQSKENKGTDPCENELSDSSIGTCSSVIKRIEVKKDDDSDQKIKDDIKIKASQDLGIKISGNIYNAEVSEYVRRICEKRRHYRTKELSMLYPKKRPNLFTAQNCSLTVKPRKNKDFLRVLREQLTAGITEEPKNLHEALKVMMRNKELYKKINFDEPVEIKQGNHGGPDCIFKRRKLISSAKRQKRDSMDPLEYFTSALTPVSEKHSVITNYSRKSYDESYTDENFPPIEVYNFGIDTVPKRKRSPAPKNKSNHRFLSTSTLDDSSAPYKTINHIDNDMASCVNTYCKT